MGAVNNTLGLQDRMTPVLRSIMKALDATLAAMASVDKVASKQFKSASVAVQQANQAVIQFRNTISNTNTNNFNNSLNNTSNMVDNLTGKIKQLVGAYLSWQGAQKLVGAGDQFISSTAQLDLMLKMNDSQRTTVELQNRIYEASQRSLGNYREMSKQVGKLGILAKDAFGGNTDEMIAFSELLNKQFSIVGATPWEKSAASYQLTQAMASGRLQGDEFRSIIENAPLLAQTIQEYMGLTGEAFKKASKDGEITADVIKNALFSVANETNEMFEKMPMRFGDLWAQVINKIDKGLEPVYIKLRQLWNNKQFQDFLTQMANVAVGVISAIVSTMSVIADIGAAMYNNWDFVEPILWGIATVVGAVVIPSLWAMVPPIWSAVAGWLALNWPIVLIGVIIAALIAVIKSFGVTTGQIIGFITAAIMTAVAVVWNLIYSVIASILTALDSIVNPILGIVEWIYNAFHGGFNGILGAFQNLIGNMVSGFLEFAKIVTPIIDAIFGTDWTKGIEDLQEKARSWGKNENALTVEQNVAMNKARDLGINRMEYGKTMKDSYQWGDNAAGKVKDMFKVGDKTYNKENIAVTSVPMSELEKNAKATNKNTKDTANALKEGINLDEKDVELLKEYARISFVNRFTTMTPQITASFGDIHENADVKGIKQMLQQSVMDALTGSLQ